MRAVKSHDTRPEIIVRRMAHAMGYRFRLHRKDLPGNPDLVLPGRRAVIFVHGCFWHGHHCKRGARIPVNNRLYWIQKIQRNRARDKRVTQQLKRESWKVMVVWECTITNIAKLKQQLSRLGY